MKYANYHGYSDVTPFEVVRVVSDKCIEVREMDCEKDDSVKLDFQVGGFSAHCTNQRDQKWVMTSNETNPVTKVRWSKANNRWQDAHGRRFIPNDKPVKFYDYNF